MEYRPIDYKAAEKLRGRIQKKKHREYIYKRLIEWGVPPRIRRFLVKKAGICLLEKIIPYPKTR